MFKFAIICSSSSSKTVGPMRAPAFLRNTARFDYQVCLFKNAIIIIGNKKVIYCKTTLTNIYTNIFIKIYVCMVIQFMFPIRIQPDICKDYKETGFCGYGGKN